MKTHTKFISATLATVSMALAGLAFAHQGLGMGQGMGQGHGMGQGMMGHGEGMTGHGQGKGQAQGHDRGQGRSMGLGQGMSRAETMPEVTARLASLKDALKITAAQEAAWQRYETVARSQAEAGEAMREAMRVQRQDPKAGGAEDHAARREAMRPLREQHRAAREAARADLVAVLTPEQNSILERSFGPARPFAQGGTGHGARGHHMGM